jgi:Asp-tRNA(Asn)/Glu-tRNA(Gln) amidotransferase B subunit
MIAQNPNTPPGLLQVLAKKKDRNIQYRLAQNPNTPVIILEEMLKHLELPIKSAAKKNLTQRLLATHSTGISQLSSSEFAMFFELALDDSISPYQAYDVTKLSTAKHSIEKSNIKIEL